MTTSIFDRRWLNIVFDGKNKAYGAFELRLINHKAVLIAGAIAIALMGTGMALPGLIKALGKGGDATNEVVIGDVELIDMETLDDVVPPPPDIEPPPLRDQLTFVAPVIVEEPTTEEVVTQESFEEAEASTETREGDTAGVDQSLDLESGPDLTGNTGQRKIYEAFAVGVQAQPPFDLNKYAKDHTEYPEVAAETGVEGTVYVRFIVDEDGKISDVQVLRDPGAGCAEAVVKMLKGMPAWRPARNNGVPVPMWYSWSFKFQLVD